MRSSGKRFFADEVCWPYFLAEHVESDMVKPALEQLGPYRLTRSLTRLGRAEVYVGRRVNNEKHLEYSAELPDAAMIKVLRPDISEDEDSRARLEEAKERFLEEGRLSARLRHPAITRTYGVAYDEGQGLHFIVQEYLDGISLAQLLAHCAAKETPLPYSILLHLVIPILKALHHAYHDSLREDGRPLRVVHRDIKPANVMLTYDGRVLLLDLATAVSTSFTRKETVQDVIVGTSHYVAPEQLFDPDSVGHATDIFGVSVILYELCTLKPLLPRTRRLSEIATALAKFNFVDYEDEIGGLRYPGLAQILAQGLSPDPVTRFLTAGEMARELEGQLLMAGDGPGLGAFAADLRRKWEGRGPSSEVAEKGGLSRKAVDRRAGDGASSLAPAASSGPGASMKDDPSRALGRSGAAPSPDGSEEVVTVSLESQPAAGRRPWLELFVAACVGFIIALITLYVMLMM